MKETGRKIGQTYKVSVREEGTIGRQGCSCARQVKSSGSGCAGEGRCACSHPRQKEAYVLLRSVTQFLLAVAGQQSLASWAVVVLMHDVLLIIQHQRHNLQYSWSYVISMLRG